MGNILEWYDFAVFGLLAVVIGKNFFPSQDVGISTISALGAFAGAYIARPFGGMIFGYIGDRFGRKSALRLSILSMGIPTVAIGVIPTYEQIGIVAPIILSIMRVLQGISIGGEFVSSMVYLSEIAPKKEKFFYSSFAIIGIVGGILLGSLACALIFQFTDNAFINCYGWRIPFLFGIIIIAFGIWMRRNMTDSHVEVVKTNNPTMQTILHHKKELILVIALTAYIGISFHTVFIWFPTYLSTIVEPNIKQAISFNYIALLPYAIFVFFGAYLADKYGEKFVFLASVSLYVIVVYPAFIFVNHGDLFLAILAQCILGALLAVSHSLSPVIISRLFPSKVRVSGLGLGFNIMVAIFAGTAPIMLTYTIKLINNKMLPAYYIIASSVIAIVAFLISNKHKLKHEL